MMAVVVALAAGSSGSSGGDSGGRIGVDDSRDDACPARAHPARVQPQLVSFKHYSITYIHYTLDLQPPRRLLHDSHVSP